MAIAYDAFTLIGTPATGSISGTHTPVGTPKGATIWVVSMVGTSGALDEISTVTYGGVSCTEVAGSPSYNDTGATEDSAVHCFHLGSGIPTGAQTVAVTATGSVGINAVYCITTTASNNTEVVDTTVITGITSNPSGTLSLGGVSCFCAQGWFSGLSAPGNTALTGWTERQEYDLGSNEAGLTTYDTVGTADVTFGNTCAADEFNYLAVAIRESAGGAAYTLTADTGAFTLTGNAAGLIAARWLTASSGTFALTGYDAGLIAARVLTAASGTFALTGYDATLTYSPAGAYTLTAESGAFALTGYDATFVHGYSLTADAGAFTLTGIDAGLTYGRAILCETGVYALTGYDATLDYSGAISSAALSAPRSINRNIQTGQRNNIQTSRRNVH